MMNTELESTEEESIDINLKQNDILFLEAVRTHRGEATTSDIRDFTGLNRNKVNYRFDRLEDRGLIEVSRAKESTGSGVPPKVATLTAVGEQAIEQQDDIRVEELPERVKDEFLIQYTAIEGIQKQIEQNSEKLKLIESTLDEAPPHSDSIFGQFVKHVEWMNRTVETVDGIKETQAELKEDVDELKSIVSDLEQRVSNLDSEGNEC